MDSTNTIDTILRQIDKDKKNVLTLLTSIARIPAPTGREQKKMQFFKKILSTYGVKKITIDDIGNCLIRIISKNNKNKKTILVVAHADTACDPGRKVVIREDKNFIYGHGICDNSAGVVAILTTIAYIKKYKLEFPHDLIFGFTVGEEGLGAKRGMKQIIKEHGKKIDAVINIESHNIGRITNQAIGQFRCSLEVDTKVGGHSYRDFGRPNANVLLSQIISDFANRSLPHKKGKTTFNVGKLSGEGSINAISTNASCLLEIRSENNAQLLRAKKIFESLIIRYKKRYPKVVISIKVTAETAAVVFPSSHRLYSMVGDVQKKLGIPSTFTAGNTDGDVSLAKHIPTVTIGTSRGWNTHSLGEYMEKSSLSLGIKQAFMLIYQSASLF
jgi:acetylornithine deacetylase/succinyl-diaminopimelate desuccinylase-like protein